MEIVGVDLEEFDHEMVVLKGERCASKQSSLTADGRGTEIG